MTQPTAPTPPLTLVVDQINAYYGESHILRNVVTIEPGEVVCLMGHAGWARPPRSRP
ncbi:MAG: hypothetical protein MRJ68_14990 [Nitrospira sp.]|nr:hypothetical protein [Nitrospira sp.]